MSGKRWEHLLLPRSNDAMIWELFHENSKIGRYGQLLPDRLTRKWMHDLHESLPFEGYPAVELPGRLPRLKDALTDVMRRRTSVRDFVPGPIMLRELAAILHYGYGVSRHRKRSHNSRSLRLVPSGGAVYPLEIFFYSTQIRGLRSGVYHYNPPQNNIRLLRQGDATEDLAFRLVETESGHGPAIARSASVVLFITAIFERSTFKYGDRGYRLICLEAGHVAQNINLIVTALNLGSVNITGFFDREMDDFLRLDGLSHSTMYMIAIGQPNKRTHAPQVERTGPYEAHQSE